MSKWEARARATIDKVISANLDLMAFDLPTLTKRIDDAYPFGPRSNHPYKIWLRVRKQILTQLAGGRAPAPDTMGRPCPTCGAAAYAPCIEMAAPLFPGDRVELDVPHESRRA